MSSLQNFLTLVAFTLEITASTRKQGFMKSMAKIRAWAGEVNMVSITCYKSLIRSTSFKTPSVRTQDQFLGAVDNDTKSENL